MKKNTIAGPCSLILTLLTLALGGSLCFAQSTATLRPYDGLKGKEREQKLIEGAKKEGKLVVYSFTAVDQLKPLLDEFQKKYPFITAEHYRANASGVFNKFATESRAGQTLADVIDISAGETHTLWQMGLIDPYLSASREGIPKDFMDEKGFGPRIITSSSRLASIPSISNLRKRRRATRSCSIQNGKGVFRWIRRIKTCSAPCCFIGESKRR
jgi:hypothetical protein